MEIKMLKNEKNVAEFEMVGADIALPQLLVAKLNGEKDVEFAAFKKEHPLVGHPIVIVKTKKKDALGLVMDKVEEIKEEVEEFKKQFKEK
jgi:DNA-directed RNA polymerase subunit L